jgi:hypothetical protein
MVLYPRLLMKLITLALFSSEWTSIIKHLTPFLKASCKPSSTCISEPSTSIFITSGFFPIFSNKSSNLTTFIFILLILLSSLLSSVAILPFNLGINIPDSPL